MTRDRTTASVRQQWRRFRSRLAPHYSAELEKAVGRPATLLDVGCGARSPIDAFSVRLPYSVGVDGFEPALRASKAAAIHDEYRQLDVRRLDASFEPRSFEVVLAVDLLEHLEAEEGVELLAAMARIASKRVVVFTPNGFVPQGVIGGNPLQIHHSGWNVATLRSLGYDVIGVHGFKFLRSHEASIRWRPRRFWSICSDLTQPVARRRPSTAYHLLAVRQSAATGHAAHGGERQL